MRPRVMAVPPDLYEADETDWLERMAGLIEEGRFDELLAD